MDVVEEKWHAVISVWEHFLGEQQLQLGEMDAHITQLTPAVLQVLLARPVLVMSFSMLIPCPEKFSRKV